jgi:hypothetical protein
MTSSVMEVQLIKEPDDWVTVLINRSNKGQFHKKVKSCFAGPCELEAVSLALNAIAFDKMVWAKSPDLFEALKKLGLANEQGFVDLRRSVGRQLFESFFPDGNLREALHATIQPCSGQKEMARLELRYDADAPELGSLPWELLYDEKSCGYLFSGSNTVLVRYVSYAERVVPLALSEALRVLLVTARPISASDDPMPVPSFIGSEGKAISTALEAAEKERRITLVPLPPASAGESTCDLLNDFLDSAHVVHIDAHGGFGRRCERCRALNDYKAQTCAREVCKGDQLESPQGYVAFERGNREPDWTSAEELGNFLKGKGVRLVVLTTCKSAVMSGRSVFSGIAPAMIRVGVPAVFAMQYSVSFGAALDLTYRLYGLISRPRPLIEVLSNVHTHLFKAFPSEWYRPVLYLRVDVDNGEGRLFSTSDDIESGDMSGKDTATAIGKLIEREGMTLQGQEARAKLKRSCQRIKLMAFYKHTHDLIQQLDSDYRQVRSKVDDLIVASPGSTVNWTKLNQSIESMKRTINRLSKHTAAGQVVDGEKDWISDISNVPQKIEAAKEAASAEESWKLLETELIAIEETIKVRSPAMNKSMLDTLKELELPVLVGMLRRILPQIGNDGDEVDVQWIRELHSAIAKLDDQAARLQEMLDRHDNWQLFEDELRSWAERLPGQTSRFTLRWEDKLRDQIPALAPSADLFRSTMELNNALELREPSAVASALDVFRDKVLTEFSSVDTDLRIMCDQLEDCSNDIEEALEV